MAGISQVCPDYRLKPIENRFTYGEKGRFPDPGSDMENFSFYYSRMFVI